LNTKAKPKAWVHELDAIESLCGVPSMTAARLLRIMEQDLAADHYKGKKNAANQDYANALQWRPYARGGYTYRLVVTDNRYTAIPAHLNNEIIVPTVMDMIDDSTDAVIELGCGYGRHLFALRDLAEHQFPKLQYIGCELSETGLAGGKRIATLEPGRASVSFQSFNYLRPSFEFLRPFKNVIFFTCHSIEQVRMIDDELFHAMVGAVPVVRCVHCEPVGWQLNPDVMGEIESGAIHERRGMNIPLGGAVDEFHTARAPLGSDWNINLVERLKSLGQQGIITVDLIERNCAGNDIYNPSTIIRWTKP